MRSRLVPWLAVLTLTAAGAAAAAGYGLTAPKRYRATAELLVSPVATGDQTFAGINVLRDTGGKQTAAADVAALLRAPQIADAVAAQLALKRSRSSLQNALHAHVVGSSDVVAVTAEDSTPTASAQLANTFASALITQRSATFQSDLAAAIRRDEQFLASNPGAAGGAAVAQRLTTLRGLEGKPDPTISIAAQATAPTSAYSPKLARLIAIGAGLGAALGVVIAVLMLATRRVRHVGGAAYDRNVASPAAMELADRLEARLAAREAALAARERDLQAALDELREARAVEHTANDEDLVRREEALRERLARVTAREVELAKRAAALA